MRSSARSGAARRRRRPAGCRPASSRPCTGAAGALAGSAERAPPAAAQASRSVRQGEAEHQGLNKSHSGRLRRFPGGCPGWPAFRLAGVTRLNRYFLPDREAPARRRRGALAQADGARRARPPGRRGPLDLPAGRAGGCTARSSRSCARSSTRSARQEMLMPVLQPAELWKQSGRYGIDELFKLEGPPRRRARARDDARGERDVPRLEGRPLLPRPAADPLPLPDQGAGRAAPARRRAAHARVHHEGLLHVRPRRGRACSTATTCTSRPTTASSTAAGSSGTGSSRTSG